MKKVYIIVVFNQITIELPSGESVFHSWMYWGPKPSVDISQYSPETIALMTENPFGPGPYFTSDHKRAEQFPSQEAAELALSETDLGSLHFRIDTHYVKNV